VGSGHRNDGWLRFDHDRSRGSRNAGDLKLQPVAIGWIFTVQALGVIAGAIVLGPLADRIGRKQMLVAATLIFGFFSSDDCVLHNLHGNRDLPLPVRRRARGSGAQRVGIRVRIRTQRIRATITTGIWLALPLGGMLSGFTASG
jgi:AAHS family 4-hydroxybenzoate transporter-like MFS transporter